MPSSFLVSAKNNGIFFLQWALQCFQWAIFVTAVVASAMGIRGRRMFWGWLLRDFSLLPRALVWFRASESFILSVVASLECYKCKSHTTPDDCSKSEELTTCAGDENCVQYEINLVGNETLISYDKGCLKSSLCSAYIKGGIGVCIRLSKEGHSGECNIMCCNEDRCNRVSVVQTSVLLLLLGILIAAVSN